MNTSPKCFSKDKECATDEIEELFKDHKPGQCGKCAYFGECVNGLDV